MHMCGNPQSRHIKPMNVCYHMIDRGYSENAEMPQGIKGKDYFNLSEEHRGPISVDSGHVFEHGAYCMCTESGCNKGRIVVLNSILHVLMLIHYRCQARMK